MAMRQEVSYTPYATFLKEQTGNVITFAQFEKGNILPETRNDAESGDEYDKESIMMSEQDMNGQVEVTWRTLRTVAHSFMVYARAPGVYVHFALMYMTDHIFPVLPIKDLINKDGDPTTPHKLATGTKPSA